MQTNLKFVHTSFHGVGHDYVQLAFQAFGFQPPIPVPEQKDPDPDFSTVKCPNPEEGESVLVFFVSTSSDLCVSMDFSLFAYDAEVKNKKEKGVPGFELC